jgi:hypothetical protein
MMKPTRIPARYVLGIALVVALFVAWWSGWIQFKGERETRDLMEQIKIRNQQQEDAFGP